jgi:hypothetical protein
LRRTDPTACDVVDVTEWFPALRGAKSVDPSRTTLATDQKMRRFGRDDTILNTFAGAAPP